MMQNSLLLGKCAVNNEVDHLFELQYFLLDEDESFGLSVVKTRVVNNMEIKEEEIVNGISESEDFVKELAERLKNNLVTPICTREVIDDFLSFES